ncbi:glycosyltransferase family 4 protein [Mastigocoleus testarum]|uniref:Glycoside hydrolase n=2 Tax=Mastigocoleus TaxID=996924 RepID=A0A0V7ZLS1_9CYAN|nr:glycoside hydrolase [Mastigocoleus testarum BC008]KST68940.1 glycoside hydrolase [Mastigocoleus testarum BC008]
MKIAYLVNQYPKVSHSFIRREIAAVEKSGLTVERFSVRQCESELIDPDDKSEFQKTKIILNAGAKGLLIQLFTVALKAPIPWLKSLWLAINIGRSSQRGIFYHFIYFAEACVLLGWLQKADIDHLHVHFGTNSATVAMLCNALGGPPYSFTVHGPEEFDRIKDLAIAQKINRASFVVAICSFGKSQLYRWCDYKQWSKIHVVHCGVDENFLNQTVKDISPEPHLTCVGRLCEQKGQLLLLQAVGQLSQEGKKCKLTLVGDGELRPEVEALIAEYGLEEQVTITGWASGEEVKNHIANARVLVLPSFAEGLPVVIMEALALGRPVISTYVAGIPELVNHGVNGWLVPAGSIEELKNAIRSALVLPAEDLAKMGRAGSESVFLRHNIGREADKLVELFHSYSKTLGNL